MGTITIVSDREYKEQPVPEVGKKYHIFDDGKIKPSRHYVAEIIEVIPFLCWDFKLLEAWNFSKEDYPWLYNETTDYFIKAKAEGYNHDDFLYFVRTKYGGWFSLDYPNQFISARLDIDNSLYHKMCEEFNWRI